eukprot:gene25194-31361_t
MFATTAENCAISAHLRAQSAPSMRHIMPTEGHASPMQPPGQLPKRAPWERMSVALPTELWARHVSCGGGALGRRARRGKRAWAWFPQRQVRGSRQSRAMRAAGPSTK